MPVTKSSAEPMRTDFYYESQCGGRIHGCRWAPKDAPRAVLQIVHGIAEYVERYDDFANYLSAQGYLVVAEDHMGHGKSISERAPQGYFSGGWSGAVEDTCRLMKDTMQEFPDVPYVLFGHSMGSFMARTILAKFPDSGINAAIICGTGWQSAAVLSAGRLACRLICTKDGEKNPSKFLQSMAFGGYNKKVEHPRTASDWLARNQKIVDAYEADPLCGFIPSAGLMRDMMDGIAYIQDEKNLANMKKNLPVFFIAGGDDPVGAYGKGVIQSANAFKRQGMEQVDMRIYPLCRHEILNEINKEEVYKDVAGWLETAVKKADPVA